MALKRSNPDESGGILTGEFVDSFFSDQERQGVGASELIKAGKTDSPDDQLLRTIFKNEEQAQAFASMLQRAERFHSKSAKAFCTYMMESLVSVNGLGRLQFLQGLTLNWDSNIAAKLMNTNADKKNVNSRPIGPGD